mgnify:CR=1 FL=1
MRAVGLTLKVRKAIVPQDLRFAGEFEPRTDIKLRSLIRSASAMLGFR